MTTSSAVAPAAQRPWFVRALRVLGTWLVIEIVLVALAFGWVAIYAYALAPGHDPAHYEEYAQRASPIVGIVISAPVFFALGFLCARRAGAAGVRFARTTTLVFLAIDFALMALVPGALAEMWAIWCACTVLKLGGLVLGGRLGARAGEARS